MSSNPFLSPEFTINWAAHTPEHIEPAIEQALADSQAAIDTIAQLPLEDTTFENTFVALEDSTELLSLAWGKVSHLQSVEDSPPLRDAQNKMLPKVSAFFARIPLNPELWLRLKTVAESAEAAELTGVKRRFLDETVADFREEGADLPEADRTRLEEIQGELAKLTQEYSENVLDGTNAWDIVITDEARLAGIPEHARSAARQSAQAKGHGSDDQPAWRFTLQFPSYVAVMTHADDDELRREMHQAFIAVGSSGKYDNRPLVPKILALRDEKAKLLGKDNFADLVLTRRMAKTGASALAFVEELQAKSQAQFEHEIGEREAFKAGKSGEPLGRLKAWEVRYWGEKQRKAQHDFDAEELRPYLPVDRVIPGLFELCSRVFGLKIEEHVGEPGYVWHDEVKFYTMHDDAGRHLGSFYADWHPRESKRGGAWMGHLITGGPQPDGSRAPHLGYITGNLSPPIDGRPALLTHPEVETIFHEFGHLLHQLLGEVEIKSLNGTSVAWDFVELPSQIMENWCWERESLDLFARHHETGEPIPEDLFQRMLAARNFGSAGAMIRQLQFGKMDLLMHTRTPEFVEVGADGMEAKLYGEVKEMMFPSDPPVPTNVNRFGHLFSSPTGYAAGYYSYKWAEVLEADAFGRFKAEGLFNRETGREFVDCVLSRGNSDDPAKLFRAFRGRDPDPAALLERSGLLPVA
jgi:oligopeptidase A